jgi:protein-S-isoprenylcysteine O-methyltransferase Ste14
VPSSRLEESARVVRASTPAQPSPRVERLLVLLSRWRINLGFLIGIPAILLAHPSRQSVLAGVPLVLAGVAIRIAARGSIDRRQYLTQVGPYRYVRHPLYVGSSLMGVGVAAMSGSLAFVALFVVVFLVMYVPQALREDAFLRKKYGEEYERYAARVPAALPRLARAPRPSAFATQVQAFRWERVMRQREWRTWIGAFGAVLAMWALASGWVPRLPP